MFRVFSQETAVWFNGLVASDYTLSGALILLFYAVLAFLVSASFKEYDSAGAFTLWELWRREKQKHGAVRLSTAWLFFLRAMLVPLSLVLFAMIVGLFAGRMPDCEHSGDALCWDGNGLVGVHGYVDFVGYLIVALQGHVVSTFIVLISVVGMAACGVATACAVLFVGEKLPIRL